MKKLVLITIVFLSIFASCKKNNVTPQVTLTATMARDSLYYIMKEFYFWYNMPEAEAVARLIVGKIPYLAAISAGAVFMGANTYIGNAPNFMVKSIAEEAGVAMPSFFGYMFKYSIPILVVLFVIMTFIFY